ncbi:hypothetical protein DRJ19_04125 [Candidatus Woesearchaeota archaeon]|nr:MAG: hypothetical protein DRJ19_04125 [Candidatus Woesearchaeota archaeon]
MRERGNIRIGAIEEITVTGVDAKITDFAVVGNVPEDASAYYQFYKCKVHADSELDLEYRVRLDFFAPSPGAETSKTTGKMTHGTTKEITFAAKPPDLGLTENKQYSVMYVYLDAKDPRTGKWVTLREYLRADTFWVEKKITCWEKTPHYSSGCELLKHYADDQCVVSSSGAWIDKAAGRITIAELDFVEKADGKDANTICANCCTPAPKGRICDEHDIPSSVKAGTSVDLGVCVENTGKVKADFWVDVKISGPEDYSETLTSEKKSIDVGKKDKIYVTWDLPLNLKSGTYTIDATLYA